MALVEPGINVPGQVLMSLSGIEWAIRPTGQVLGCFYFRSLRKFDDWWGSSFFVSSFFFVNLQYIPQ